MKIRIKFAKRGEMKFIGHLDLMRYFQKCMRRAGIDIAYSEGFKPHQIMSFAAPLGVGLTSGGEYLDIEVNSTKTSAEAVRDLNLVMADGMEILSYRRLKDTDKKAMSLVAAADYEVRVKEGHEAPNVNYQEALEEFFYRPKEILVTKQAKKSVKTIDLKQTVHDFQIRMEENTPVFFLKLCTGSAENVKPELVLEAFYQFLGHAFDVKTAQIHRIDVYGIENGEFLSLGETGEIIEQENGNHENNH